MRVLESPSEHRFLEADGPLPPERARPRRSRDAGADRGERTFLEGPASRATELWRAARIFAEFVRGFRRMHFIGPCATVFGSARFGEDHPYYALARETGAMLARDGFTVMTGGGPGIMEAANRGAREMGGYSVGCNIVLPEEQAPNPYLDLMIEFDHFYVRKVMLVKYSYGFVVLPGGLGTMDEMFEVLTLLQTGKLAEMPLVLVGSDYWSPLVDWLRDRMVRERTISRDDLDLLHHTDSPAEAARIVRERAAAALARRPAFLRRPRRILGEPSPGAPRRPAG